MTGVPYSTIVGGVSLVTSGAGGTSQSNPTWGGSGGGISGYGIPNWQQGIDMSSNLGSTHYRNYPDVAMPADNIFTVYRNDTVIGGTGGTSACSPLWAGFMALVNQEAASQGMPPVGFPNPAIYAIGKVGGAVYTSCFHDVTTGNTFNSHNPNRFAAQSGYDLCTGWGSPTGIDTISALIGTGTNDFTFSSFQSVVNIVGGGSANAAITMTGRRHFVNRPGVFLLDFSSAVQVGFPFPNCLQCRKGSGSNCPKKRFRRWLVDDKTGFFGSIGPGQNRKIGNELTMNLFRPKNELHHKSQNKFIYNSLKMVGLLGFEPRTKRL